MPRSSTLAVVRLRGRCRLADRAAGREHVAGRRLVLAAAIPGALQITCAGVDGADGADGADGEAGESGVEAGSEDGSPRGKPPGP